MRSASMASKIKQTERFDQYMLKELDMSWDYHKFLTEQGRQARDTYHKVVAVVFGASVPLAAANPTLLLPIVGVGTLIIGVWGSFTLRQRIDVAYKIIRESRLRLGLHNHFRQLNRKGFKRFGGELMLGDHKGDFRSNALSGTLQPYLNTGGLSGIVHSIVGGAGFALLISSFFPGSASPAFRLLFIPFSAFLGVIVAFGLFALIVLTMKTKYDIGSGRDIALKQVQFLEDDTQNGRLESEISVTRDGHDEVTQ